MEPGCSEDEKGVGKPALHGSHGSAIPAGPVGRPPAPVLGKLRKKKLGLKKNKKTFLGITWHNYKQHIKLENALQLFSKQLHIHPSRRSPAQTSTGSYALGKISSITHAHSKVLNSL